MGRKLDEAFRRGGQGRVRSLRLRGRAQRDGLGPGRRLGVVDRAGGARARTDAARPPFFVEGANSFPRTGPTAWVERI